MSFLVVLAVLVGTAVAAPQGAYKSYKPLPYSPLATQFSPIPGAYAPLAYSAAYRPVTPLAPVHVSSQYNNLAYSAPTPVVSSYNHFPYSAPAPVASSYKPLTYSTPAYKPLQPYQYSPQEAYPHQYIKPIAIVRQSQDNNFDGSYSYDFEAENGIASQESGYVKNPGTDAETQVVQGQYSYTAPDGTPIVTRYFADETGFHADGSHIPVAPADPYRTA